MSNAPRIEQRTANFTAEFGRLYLCDASAGAMVVTLPRCSVGLAGIAVKKTDDSANDVTVTRAGSALIDGATTVSLASQYDAVEVVPDGANWQVLASIVGVPPADVPDAPTIGAATAGNAAADVAFTPPVFNGGAVITGYTATSTPGGITASGTSSPITVPGLTNGTAYTFTVHATNSAGDSAESAATNSVTPSATPVAPGAPTIGTATAGDTEATANWTAPASDGGSAITGYQITTHDSAGTLLDTDTVGVVLTFTKTGLTNGVGVKFKVAAINAVSAPGAGPQTTFSNTVTPAGFSPETYASLVDWIEPQEMVSPPSDGTAIDSMPNLHSGGQTYTQATGAKQPIYRASVAAFNGKAVLRFDVANAQILDTAAPVSTLTAGYTHVIIASTASTSAERCVCFNGNRAANGCGLYLSSGSGTPGAAGNLSILQGGTVWQDTSPPVAPSSTPSIFMWHRDATTGVTTLYVNGVPAPIVSDTNGSSAPGTRSSIGGDGTFFHDGDIALKLTYNAKRSKAELNVIGVAYQPKYGYPWTTIV